MKETVNEPNIGSTEESSGEETDTTSRFLDTLYKQLGWALGSIILALIVAALIMLAADYDPGLAFVALIRGAVTSFDQLLWYATPLILTGLSVALAFKAGLFNIGAEGQLFIGAMTATLVGYMIALPIIVHPLACLIVGAICGGLWGLLPGLLKAYRGAHEVVTTMMLSYIAIYITQWLVAGPLKEPGEFQWVAQTPPLLPTAWLPRIFGPFLHWGLFLALLAVVAAYTFLSKTILGYELRAVGLNMEAAESAGINSKHMIAIALAISGALAGLAGASEIMGYFHRFRSGWSSGLGFDGITVAVLGNNNPWGVLAGALFFGFLRAGSTSMQVTAQVPVEMVGVIQGLIVLFVAVPKIIDWLAKRGSSYATWIQQDPKNALPFFVTTMISLVGAAIGFGLGLTTLSSDPVIALALVPVAIIGLVAFIGLLARKSWGPVASLNFSIAWIPIGICNAIFQSGNLLIPLLVLGITSTIFSGLTYYLMRWRGIAIGGDF